MNIFENIPYHDQGMGKRKLVDEAHLLLMQAALKSGQCVPRHTADSNVHILVVEGSVVVQLDGSDHPATTGTLLPVKCGTPMQIRNDTDAHGAFLIIKTPHPRQKRAG